MRAPLRLACALLLLAGAGCGYSPNPASGKLLCGPQSSCPEGYACTSGTCWRPAVAKLLGHWVFAAGAATQIACSDGSSSTTPIAASDAYLDITPGSRAVLATNYFCDWDLDANGSTTAIAAGQSCSAPDPNDASITYLFQGEALTLSTPDGKTGTLSASFPYSYTSTAGSGTCTLKISTDLTKN